MTLGECPINYRILLGVKWRCFITYMFLIVSGNSVKPFLEALCYLGLEIGCLLQEE